ncbi:L-tyrosine decarboxylase-like [Ylistrum balloti]|uniref:L-tyrosine decarboxylase-like n=1 Tax=Ylistrum balloti TaxID=509963 RepID=UPI002905A50F|nr:L-tyrosine decarboxylase-like [Ylistrum balloti]
MAYCNGFENAIWENRIDADVCGSQWKKLGSWFIGTSGENEREFLELALNTLQQNIKPRKYIPEDPLLITPEVKSSAIYRDEMAKLKVELKFLNETLAESIPYSSVRYQGHMVSKTTIPAKLGFLSAWMTNANNACGESGPVTIQLEKEVGKQLCDLIGFDVSQGPRGYITSGGSSANIEALWASRNVKFFPLAVQKAIREEPTLADVKDLRVYIPRLDRKQKLISCSTWDLLNLKLDDVIYLPQEIERLTSKDHTYFQGDINKYSMAYKGFVEFFRLHDLIHYNSESLCEFDMPPKITILPPNKRLGRILSVVAILALSHLRTSNKPYLSVKKCSTSGRAIVIVAEASQALRKRLEECLVKKVPIIALICVIGTTEHGAVDPVEEILKLRAEYRKKGLNFYLLADGAWGGYFATLMRKPEEKDHLLPAFPISNYVCKQISCLKDVDTVTIDPHKTGYCPYPAGGICYRNGQMKSALAFATDMLHGTGYTDSNCYGLETSKPGAAAAGVYLAHKVIGLHSSGYGRILGQSILGAKLFYCAWLTAANPDDEFVCVPLIPIPEAYDEEKAMKFIRKRILHSSYEDIVLDIEAMDFLSEIGPDLFVNAFAVNVKGNACVVKCNRLNMAVFNRLSHTDPKQRSVCDVPLFLTKSRLSQKECSTILGNFKERLGVSKETADVLVFLKNTVMNPWTAADQTIQMLVRHFRQVVTQCIAEINQTE